MKKYDNYDYEEAFKKYIDDTEEERLEKLLREGKVNCLYRTATTKCTNIKSQTTLLEARIYPSYPRLSDMPKTKKRPSSKAQRNLNDKNARRYLIRLANINFGKGDLWCTFGWNDDKLPADEERARKDIKNFIAKINYRRKRKGLENIKYIYVLAFDGYVRPHFHILMTGDGMDRDELESLWKKCDRPNTRRISPNDDFLITGLAATAATVPATAEYRKIMGSLEVSSQNAGYTAEQTAESYRTLYGVLADDQTAATTTANLQALGLSQEELSTVIEGTIGAWATYGDSIPIDGLAESINETVKTSTVTGTFADMLNWAGTSEDAFNEKLAACGSESERVNLVMQEMANQGLVDAGKKWQENNKNLVDGNKATADFQQATAELADTVAPLITKITELVAGLIEEFNQLSPEGQRVIAGCVLVVAAVGPVFSIISKVSGGVFFSFLLSSLIGIISKIAPVLGPIKTGFAAVNAVMAANPILIIIAAVAALIAIFVTLYNKCEWFRDGVNAIFGAVADFIKGAIDKIKGFFDFDWKLPKIKLPHFKASGEWSLSPLKVPKISVDWYANGGILNSPTIFGANGDSLMGGGEAGKEAVLPIKLLKDYIREENDANNATLAAMIVEAFKSISMTAENNIYIGDKKSITLLTNLVLKQMANKTLATQGAKGK